MNFINNLALQWRNKSLNKSSTVGLRKTLNYAQASAIGILVLINSDDDYTAVDAMVAKLKAQGKKVKVLAYQHASVSTANSLKYNFFRAEDLSVSGKINSEEVIEFINTNFDYLYCLSTMSSDMIDHIMLQSKALCRIGNYIPGKEHCFEMMVNVPGESLNELSQQLLHFTSIITNNEK